MVIQVCRPSPGEAELGRSLELADQSALLNWEASGPVRRFVSNSKMERDEG